MATFQPLTQEQYQKARASGFSPDKIVEMEKIRKSQFTSTQPEEKKGILGKIGEFLAPTASRSVGKLKEGEGLTGRDIAGSALEVGSYLLPVGAIARGVGLAGKGALTLGRKLGLGALGGGAAGGTFETGRAIGEGKGALEVAESGARGLGIGATVGAGLPLGVAGARAIPRIPGAVSRGAEATQRGALTISKGAATGARAVGGVAEEGIRLVGKKIPEKTGQFVERRAERAAFLKGKPAHVKEAVSKNIERPDIEFITNSSKTDKKAYLDALELAKKGATNRSFGNKPSNSPKTIVGRTITEGPVSHLIGVKDRAVAKTKKVLEGLGPKPQNARNIYDQFISDMADAGVVPIGNRLAPTRGSRVPDGDLKFYQQVFNELKPTKQGRVPLTYNQMHQLRQKWFDVARADKTFTSGTTSYARRLRSLLAQNIDEASGGKYLAAQNETREALEGLQDYIRLTGYKGRLEDITTQQLRSGEVFMRALGNAAGRIDNVLQKIYGTAKKYGYKGQEDIFNQLDFVDGLEDIYQSSLGSRSLKRQVGRGVSGSTDPFSTAASLGREATKWTPVSAVLRGARGFLGGTGDETLKAFENLIRAEAGQKILQSKTPGTIGALLQQTKEASSPLIKEGKEAIKKANELGKKKK